MLSPSQKASLQPGSDREHVMLSGRFDKPEIIKYIKDVKRGLDERGVKTYMVECSEGDDFSEATMEGLDGAWAMVVFGTSEYGAKTGAGYETYEELRYAHQKKLPLFPIQLCDRWPPAPRDSDGGKKGKAQNGFVLRDTVIRLCDPEMKKPQEIAEKLAERLLGWVLQGLVQKPDRDRDANPAICKAAEAGDVAAVRHLIRADSGAVHRTNRYRPAAQSCGVGRPQGEGVPLGAALAVDVD
eukprot:Skav226746  [mRNA]  locus=scaffold2152:65163:73206:+ [translate_table: standard]